MDPGLPYAPVSPSERRRRAQELLARHSRAWDAQMATFTAQNPQKPHHSNLQIDAEWREKQRALARADANSRQNYEISWQNSLRTDERVVELKLGKVNPVSFFKRDSAVNKAIQNILEMPAYVPVNEKLPMDLVQKNLNSLQNHLNLIENAPEVNEIELYLENSVTDEDENEIFQTENADESNVQIVKNKFQSMIPAGQNAQKADEIARKIVKYGAKIKNQRLDLNKINKQAIIEPLDSVQTHIRPRIQIGNLTVISSETSKESCLRMKNIGDCSVQISIRQKNSIQPSGSKKHQQASVQDETISESHVSPSQKSTLPPPSPASILGKLKTTKFPSTTQQFNMTKKQVVVPVNQQVVVQARDDMAQKMLEKSSTPSHLRILANRCVQAQRGAVESKIIVATKGAKWLCGSGESSKIEFIVPNNKQQQPGIILQEYEIIFTPAVEIEFENLDDQKSGNNSVIQCENQTSVFIRCYGIQSWCLQLKKQIDTMNVIGGEIIEKIYNNNVCQEIMFELADTSVNISLDRIAAEKQAEAVKNETQKSIENIVIQTYQNNIIKPKWLIDKNEIKQFLYDLITTHYGYSMSILDVFDNYYDFDANLRFDESDRLIFEFLKSIESNQPQAFPLSYLQFAKNSLYKIRANSLQNTILKSQFLFQNIEIFDKQRQNSCKMVRNRLLALISDEKSSQNIIINQTSDSEYFVMQQATRGSLANAALFAEFKPSKLVNVLIDKLINQISGNLTRQVLFDKKKSYTVDDGQKITANKRPVYDGNLTNLMMLACSAASKTPVWDIFGVFCVEEFDSLILLNFLMLKKLIFDVEINVSGENEGNLREVIGNQVNQQIIDRKCVIEYEKSYLEGPSGVFQPKSSLEQIQALIEIIKQNLGSESENFTSQFSLEFITENVVPDLVYLLKTEFLYNETMKNRTFLKLFYLEIANLNEVDPINILTIQEKLVLTQSNTFNMQDYSQIYYEQIFTAEALQRACERLQTVLPSTPSKNAAKPVKGQKEIKAAILAPIETKLQTKHIFTPVTDTYEKTLRESLAQQIKLAAPVQPSSSNKQKRDPKQIDQQQIVLKTGLNGQLFSEFTQSSLFSSMLRFYEIDIQNDQQLDKISYTEMLVDVVNVIMSISAAPKIPLFNDFKIDMKHDLIETQQLVAKETRETLLAQIQQLNVIPDSQPKKGGKSSIDIEMPQTDSKIIQKELISNLSNVIFYTQDSLISEINIKPKTSVSRLENSRNDLILTSSAALPISFKFQKPVKNFTEKTSTYEEFEENQEVEVHDQIEFNMTPLPPKVEEFSISHEIRLQAFRQEFDVFIDAIFTEITTEAVTFHIENKQNYEIELDDFEVLKSKMEQLKSGEINYEQAGIEQDEFQEPEEMVAPVVPVPENAFSEIISSICEIEKKIQVQSDILFCKGSNLSLLTSLGHFCLDVVYKAYLKYIEQSNLILENDFHSSDCENQGMKVVFDCAESLGLNVDVFGMDPRLIKGLEEVTKHPQVEIQDIEKTVLFMQIQKYFKAFGINLELEQTLTDYQRTQAKQLIPTANQRNVQILENFEQKFVNTQTISQFLYQNAEKLIFKPIPQVFLLSELSILNEKTQETENLEGLIEVTQDNFKTIFEALGCQLPQKDKKKEEKNKPVEVIEKIEELAEGEEEEEEEQEIKIPGYLKEVEPEVQCKREIWGFLFDKCLERSSHWFAAADKIEHQFNKALNYVSRDWKELYDE